MTTLENVVVSSTSAALDQVIVTKVTTAQDKKDFIHFPFELYKNDPNWVPPLLMEREDFLNPKKNKWFEHGVAQLFLARKMGKIVGRIAAVEDPRYNEFHNTRIGWFGLFESIDDTSVSNALLREAEKWVRARGHADFLGPASFTSNHEWALLVDGFDSAPVMLMPYNPPYYIKLLENYGLTKAKDVWAWKIDITKPVPERIARVAEKVRQREGLVVRTAKMKDWDSEIERIKSVYNSAWEKNWGFVPMTNSEFGQMAKDLKLIIEPELCLIAEVKNEPVAFAVTLPDANHAIRAANGRLTKFGLPIGLAKLLWAKSRIRSGRLMLLGIKDGFRKRGIDSVLFLDTFNNSRKLGWWGGEISWTLEDNDMVNRAIELFGCEKYKTYRVYQKSLEPAVRAN